MGGTGGQRHRQGVKAASVRADPTDPARGSGPVPRDYRPRGRPVSGGRRLGAGHRVPSPSSDPATQHRRPAEPWGQACSESSVMPRGCCLERNNGDQTASFCCSGGRLSELRPLLCPNRSQPQVGMEEKVQQTPDLTRHHRPRLQDCSHRTQEGPTCGGPSPERELWCPRSDMHWGQPTSRPTAAGHSDTVSLVTSNLDTASPMVRHSVPGCHTWTQGHCAPWPIPAGPSSLRAVSSVAWPPQSTHSPAPSDQLRVHAQYKLLSLGGASLLAFHLPLPTGRPGQGGRTLSSNYMSWKEIHSCNWSEMRGCGWKRPLGESPV